MDRVTRTRFARAIFLVGTVGSGVWALFGIRNLMALYSSGVAAFGSADSLGSLMYLLPVLITAVLSAVARDYGRSAVVLRRAFILATLIPMALVALFVSASFSGAFAHGVTGVWIGVVIAVFVAGALWLPLQTFFAAGFLGLLIKGRTPVA
jgi:hypothetical protein